MTILFRRFFSIEVDKEGNPKPRSEAENYKMFTKPIPKIPGRKLLIAKDEEFIDQHLGKYPLIFVNFKSASILSLDNAISKCKRVFHKSFLDHKYLCKSDKLEDYEKEDCENWVKAYKSLDKLDVLGGLESLSEYSFKHFGSKCFIIVDEHDSMCASVMFEMEGRTLRRIVEFFISCLDFVAKDNNKYVVSSLFTGISHMCTTGLSRLGNILPFKFLQNDRFVEFYSLTSKELVDLKE